MPYVPAPVIEKLCGFYWIRLILIRLIIKLLLLFVFSGHCMTETVEVNKIEFEGVFLYEAQTNDPEILGVSAQPAEAQKAWYVIVTVAEFVRDEPLESKFRKLVDEALTDINGVTLVEETDREVWYVEGKVSGEVLVVNTVEALNSIYTELKEYVHSF